MELYFKNVSSNIDTINTASYFEQSEYDAIYSNVDQDLYFGTSEKDAIEFTVFDIDGNQKTWKELDPVYKYTVINNTYRNLENKLTTYSYKELKTNYKISHTRRILVDPVSDLNSIGIKSGNNVVSYNFVKNVVGNSKQSLIIKDISVSRNEIKLIPSYSENTNEEIELLNLEYIAFTKKQIFIKNILNQFLSLLDSYQIYSQNSDIINKNKESFNLIKSSFGFKDDVSVIDFFNEIYNGFKNVIQGNVGQKIIDEFLGIKSFIKHWLYQNYKKIHTYDELSVIFQDIIDKCVLLRLNMINSYFGLNEDNKAKILDFITNLFFDKFILDCLKTTYEYDYDRQYSYFKNAINIGNNRLFIILNHSYVYENEKLVLLIKLKDFLPLDVSIRSRCWISNITIPPLVQKIVLDNIVSKKLNKIAGPNFSIKTNDFHTKQVGFSASEDLQLSDSDKKTVDFYKKQTELNIDYSEFENFIIFSSAELRIKLFLNKISNISNLHSKILSLENGAISASNIFISMSYSNDTTTYKDQLESIYNSFDGFESYLYTQPDIVSGSLTVGSELDTYISSAIDFDKLNKDSLLNNTPNYVLNENENSDYLIFLSMIGHHFDNLYVYLDKVPTLQYADSSLSSSYVSVFANTLLEQFGWNPISSFDTKTIENTYITSSTQYSHDEKNKIIWNRILQNLPLLYKTKGTVECIKILANVYGIPQNILNIKEFGGNNIYTEDNSSYTFDFRYYFTSYNKNNEYVMIPYGSDIKSVEFKFKLNPDYLYEQNKSFSLIKKDNNDWYVYVTKLMANDLGTITLNISGSELSITNVPIFNGKIYNVLATKETVSSSFDAGTGTYVPGKLKFRVTHIEDDQLVFDQTKETLLTTQYLNKFTSGSTLYIGNYTSNNEIVGCIDKINVWTKELDESAYIEHCKNFDCYTDYDGNNTYSDLVFKYTFDYPVSLFTGSYSSGSYVSIENANKYYTTTASAYNFKENGVEIIDCIPYSASIYPHQFEEIDLRQNIQIKNGGPNRYKNIKINKATETVMARLMPFERSTVSNTITADSNLVGVYISPFKTRDDDIINFIGNSNFLDKIGDPSNLYESKYSNLETLKTQYNKNNLSEKIFYTEFITLFRNYFDTSFFENVKQVFPARTRILTGIVIEPTIIERNKYQHKKPKSTCEFEFNTQLTSSNYNISPLEIELLNDSIEVSSSKNGNRSVFKNVNYGGDVISDKLYEKRRSIFVINGKYSDNTTDGYVVNSVYRRDKKEYIYGTNYITSTEVSSSKMLYEYSIMLSSSVPPNNFTMDMETYIPHHYSTKRNAMTQVCVNAINLTGSTLFKKSQQTHNTTVNEKGIPDGSSPIEVTKINKEISEITLTTT